MEENERQIQRERAEWQSYDALLRRWKAKSTEAKIDFGHLTDLSHVHQIQLRTYKYVMVVDSGICFWVHWHDKKESNLAISSITSKIIYFVHM